MSQFEIPSSEPMERKTSGLAITALVCSLIFFCPLTTLLGPLLGLIALAKIGPDRKGKGLALTAIVLGVIFTAISGFAIYKVGGLARDSMVAVQSAGDAALTTGFAGDVPGFKGAFYGAGAAATDAEAQAFLDTLSDRYGAFVSFEFAPDRGGTQPQFGQPFQTFPYTAVFDQATLDAEATVIFADQTTGDFVSKLGDITIIDPDLGDVTFP